MSDDIKRVLSDEEVRSLNCSDMSCQLFRLGNLIQNLQKYCQWLEQNGGGGSGSGVDQTARDAAQAAQDAVNAETANRQTGDTALGQELDSVVADFTSAYQNEISNRANGDNNLGLQKQDNLTAGQLAAANSGITQSILSAIQGFQNRADGFAAASHTHDVDNINQFSPGQYATDLPDPTATKTVKNWIRDIVNALNRLLSKTIVFTPMSYPCWVQLSGSFSYAQEIEFLSVSDFDSSSPWNCYARFKYNGNGVVRDMVTGGSKWYGTLQWFKTSLWIPVPSGGCALNIQCGRGIDLSLVTTDPARTPVTIVTM